MHRAIVMALQLTKKDQE